MKNNDMVVCPDYEAECNRLVSERSKLLEELAFAKEIYKEAQRELADAKAKLEMVYLIFGK